MIEILWPIVVVICVSIVIATIQNRRERRKYWARRSLIEKWRNARNERLTWRAQNSHLTNPFDDERYEKLWNYELGAEALIQIRITEEWESASLLEYKGELEKFNFEQGNS